MNAMLVYTHKYVDVNEYTVVSLSERCVAVLSISFIVAICPVPVESSTVLGISMFTKWLLACLPFCTKLLVRKHSDYRYSKLVGIARE
ncbi:MAG: hypothetical protein QXM43_02920 [Desulfurococcaceae archaeon]